MEDFEAWVDEVWDAFEQAARTGLPFTTSEVQRKYNLPDPPKPASQWGTLPKRLRKAGLVQEYTAGTGSSSRRSAHGSPVRQWVGVPERRRRAA
jgi:hypothetical protein